MWAHEALFERFAISDKKPMVCSRVERCNDGGVVKKQRVKENGEGEKIERSGKGLDLTGDGGGSGEGDKSVRVGSVVVKVDGEERKKKGRVRVVEEKKAEVGSMKEVANGEEVLLKEEGGVAHLGKTVVVLLVLVVVKPPMLCVPDLSRLRVYRSLQEDQLWASKGVVATVVTGDSMLSA